MIDQILEKVKNNIAAEVMEKVGMSEEQVPQALQSASDSLMKKAKGYLDSGKVMELKDIFTSDDESKKVEFLSEVKTEVSEGLQSNLNIDSSKASGFLDISVPEIIKVAKEELLGPDGKVTFADFPRLISFFKSEGKEVKSSGGLGGLFGF